MNVSYNESSHGPRAVTLATLLHLIKCCFIIIITNSKHFSGATNL